MSIRQNLRYSVPLPAAAQLKGFEARARAPAAEISGQHHALVVGQGGLCLKRLQSSSSELFHLDRSLDFSMLINTKKMGPGHRSEPGRSKVQG
jgi:hypothetical protein